MVASLSSIIGRAGGKTTSSEYALWAITALYFDKRLPHLPKQTAEPLSRMPCTRLTNRIRCERYSLLAKGEPPAQKRHSDASPHKSYSLQAHFATR